MFRETEQGETQYCPMCEEWAEKYERLQAENEELKHKNEILLGQLVINDGEDVTVQISQSQFNEYNELKADNERLKESIAQLKEKYNTLIYKKESREEAFCKQNKELYEEKNILHKIIDRLLENSGYSKDTASAEDFEDVYEDMQIKRNELEKYRKALEEIKEIAEDGLRSICYKANCATCRCYSKKISNDTLENIINDYFDEDGDFTDTEGNFFEVLQAFINRERVACNKAQPISEKIIDKISEVLK